MHVLMHSMQYSDWLRRRRDVKFSSGSTPRYQLFNEHSRRRFCSREHCSLYSTDISERKG